MQFLYFKVLLWLFFMKSKMLILHSIYAKVLKIELLGWKFLRNEKNIFYRQD